MLKLAMIVTAAGRSTRFPPNKLLQTIDELTCIEKTINTFVDFELDTTIVLGHQRDLIQKVVFDRFGNSINFVHNPDFATGLSSSVLAGIKAAGNTYDYWGFCPGDKPFIQSETVDFLIQTLEQKKPLILVPYFENQPGHPTFFARQLGSSFREITGDTGGRQVMETFSDQTLNVDVADRGVGLDMDAYLGQNNV